MSTESTSSSSSVSVQRKGWRLPAAAAAILAVSAGLFGLHGFEAKADDAPASAQPAATPVSVATVAESEVTAWDEFSGRLEAVERVDIRSRVAGAVQAVHFREGALVKQGDLLITIDPAPYAAEVERAEAQVASAQARQSYARSEQERARRLWDERAIAQRELDERINAGSEAEANLRAAQASLQSARLNLGYTQVRAPVSGRIGKREITVGNLVAAGPGAPVLTTLVSVSPIYASFDADEQVITRALKELGGGAGNRARIDSIPVQMGTATAGSTPFEGRLQLIDNQVDARSGTVRVRAAFDNKDGALMPGQFARIRMGQARDSAACCWSTSAPSAPTRTRSTCWWWAMRQQGRVPRGGPGRLGQRPAQRDPGPAARRARGRQRPAAHPPRRPGRAQGAVSMDARADARQLGTRQAAEQVADATKS